MLSIENTYSEEEVRKFATRAAKLVDGAPMAWAVELKIDGVAVSVTYENGVLAQALTRGNGKVGDDITHNMRTVVDLPLAVGRRRSAVARGARRSVHDQCGSGHA